MSISFLLVSLAIAATAAALVYGLISFAIGWLNRHASAELTPRSSHSVPTPQGGGVIIVPVALAVGGISFAVTGTLPPGGVTYAATLAVLALALTFVGFADDVRDLGVGSRLIAQVVTVGIAVATLPPEVRVLPSVIPMAIERLILIGAVVWFVNLVNFMDGIDLMSVVETVAIALGIALLAAVGVVPMANGYIAAALLGAMIGFAPWNAPRARLFLGDAGSLPIGLLVGMLLIYAAGAEALAAAVILPLYYLADSTLTLLRRLVRRGKVWQAHREHFYQRAMRNGFSVTQIIGRVALLDVVLIALALVSTMDGAWWAAVALLTAAVAVAWTLRLFARGGP